MTTATTTTTTYRIPDPNGKPPSTYQSYMALVNTILRHMCGQTANSLPDVDTRAYYQDHCPAHEAVEAILEEADYFYFCPYEPLSPTDPAHVHRTLYREQERSDWQIPLPLNQQKQEAP